FLDTLGATIAVDTTIFILVRDTMIQNEKWYFIGFNASATELLTNRSDGLWYMRTQLSQPPPALFAKYPANVNDAWVGPDSASAKVVAKDLSVSVPHGTHSCYHYTFADNPSQFVSMARYFLPGSGLIKDDFFSTTASGRTYVTYRRELVSLSLSKSDIQTTSEKRGKWTLFNPR
ncbi:MAG: hypothetical protein WBD36_07910, partial [Bacteroidota bacterium]